MVIALVFLMALSVFGICFYSIEIKKGPAYVVIRVIVCTAILWVSLVTFLLITPQMPSETWILSLKAVWIYFL